MRIVGGGISQTIAIDAPEAKAVPYLTIAVSEPPSSRAVWTLDVFAILPRHCAAYVGQIITRSPDGGDRPSRVVAWACCPGAMGWEVSATSPQASDVAELTLAAGDTGPAIVGVVRAGP